MKSDAPVMQEVGIVAPYSQPDAPVGEHAARVVDDQHDVERLAVWATALAAGSLAPRLERASAKDRRLPSRTSTQHWQPKSSRLHLRLHLDDGVQRRHALSSRSNLNPDQDVIKPGRGPCVQRVF